MTQFLGRPPQYDRQFGNFSRRMSEVDLDFSWNQPGRLKYRSWSIYQNLSGELGITVICWYWIELAMNNKKYTSLSNQCSFFYVFDCFPSILWSIFGYEKTIHETWWQIVLKKQISDHFDTVKISLSSKNKLYPKKISKLCERNFSITILILSHKELLTLAL